MFIALNGRKEQRPESDVKELWHNGTLHENTIYWKEGMVKWEPLSRYLGRSIRSTPRHKSQPISRIKVSWWNKHKS